MQRERKERGKHTLATVSLLPVTAASKESFYCWEYMKPSVFSFMQRKSNKLADQLDPFDFNIIDIREQNIFPIEAKKAKLISLHPSDSYIMRKSDDGKKVISFEITRVEEFWKNSKFMVLSLD